MDPQTKILIVHAFAGHGHRNAAEAVEEACRNAGPNAKTRLVDALDFTPRFFGASYRRAYLFLISRLPWVWGFFYYLVDHRPVYFVVKRFRRMVNALCARRLRGLLVAEAPAVVVCTHFLALEVAAKLKKAGKLQSRLVVVITDYLPHAFWVEETVDLYAVGLEETLEELHRRGVPREKIRVTGIPVQAKFNIQRTRSEAAAELRIQPEIFTVLLTSGGAGIGHNREIAGALLGLGKRIQILSVCGNNPTLFRSLSDLADVSRGQLKVFGFVRNMEVLMEASDLVIGKSGGLTLSESLSKRKPMVVIGAVPGQETRNARCVLWYEAGCVVSSVHEAARRVEEAMESPEVLRRWKDGAAKMARPDAAAAIAGEVLRGR